MPRVHITASWDIDDDQRAQSRIIHGLDKPIEAFEAALMEVVGHEVKVTIAVKRVKNTSSEIGHG